MMDDKHDEPAPDEWAIVEVMGHRQHAGRISEVTRFGAVLLRVDQPVEDGFATTLIGGSSIYALTIVTEARARATAARMADPRPPSRPVSARAPRSSTSATNPTSTTGDPTDGRYR